MKYFTMPVVASGVLAAGLGLAAVADAAPSGPITAAQAVAELQSRGFHVIVNKIGTTPLDKCVVDAVRSGQTYARMDSGAPGAMEDIVTTVTSMTVYLDVSC